MDKSQSYLPYGLLISLVLLVTSSWPVADAGCASARMCCPGKNNTCFTRGPQEEQRTGDDVRCFCDQACRRMVDCCSDYGQSCRATNCDVAVISDWGICDNPRGVATNCEVAEFSDWGKCNNPCGVGAQVRRRKVRVFPENGGDPCPILKERRGCIGEQYGACLHQRILNMARELREVSRILPAKFGHFRQMEKYDAQKDPLRRNLFADTGYHINRILTKPGYCMHFEVTEANHNCNKTDSWVSPLRVGTRVCLECQPHAMFKALGMRCKGHGVQDEVTEWNAIGVHGCRGNWRMVTKRESCTCDKRGPTDFILL